MTERVPLPGSLLERRAREAAEADERRRVQERLDRRNARRRARRAEGKGTRPAGASAPAVALRPASAVEAVAEERCDLCGEVVGVVERLRHHGLGGGLRPMSEADHARMDAAGAPWPPAMMRMGF